MKEAIVAVLTPLLVAFGMSPEQIAAIVAVIDSAVMSSQNQISKEIEQQVEKMAHGQFGIGVLSMLFQMAGISDPNKLQAILNGIAVHVTANSKADVRCQWDEAAGKFTNQFWGIDVPMDILFGQDHVMRIVMRGEVSDGTGKKPLTIAKGREKKDANGYSADCLRLANEWLAGKWSKADQNIGDFLPKCNPKTIEEALPIMKEALSKRAASRSKENKSENTGKAKGSRNANK